VHVHGGSAAVVQAMASGAALCAGAPNSKVAVLLLRAPGPRQPRERRVLAQGWFLIWRRAPVLHRQLRIKILRHLLVDSQRSAQPAEVQAVAEKAVPDVRGQHGASRRGAALLAVKLLHDAVVVFFRSRV